MGGNAYVVVVVVVVVVVSPIDWKPDRRVKRKLAVGFFLTLWFIGSVASDLMSYEFAAVRFVSHFRSLVHQEVVILIMLD